MTHANLEVKTRPPRFAGTEKGSTALKPVILAAIALCGVAVDIAWHNGPETIASTLSVVVVAAVLILSGRMASLSARLLVLSAAVFGVALSLRLSPWLVPLNFIAAWGLLMIATGISRRGRVFDAPVSAWVRLAFRAFSDAIDAVPWLARTISFGGASTNPGATRSIVLGTALATPIVLILGALLASADAVFAEAVGFIPTDNAGTHAIVIVGGALLALVLLRVASGSAPDGKGITAFFAPATALVVLGALVVLYATYATIVVTTALAGASTFLDDPAAVADWARSGFFQLLVVATLTLAILMALRDLTENANDRLDRWLRIGSTTAVLLTQFIVAAAITRIWMYSEAYGLTMLRLYSTLFAFWIATVLVFLVIRLWSGPRSPEWLPVAALVTGLAMLFCLNLVNPEAWVVRLNLERRNDVERFDIEYVAHLSADALPALYDDFAELSAAEQETVRLLVCIEDYDRSPLQWNLAAERAKNAHRAICGD